MCEAQLCASTFVCQLCDLCVPMAGLGWPWERPYMCELCDFEVIARPAVRQNVGFWYNANEGLWEDFDLAIERPIEMVYMHKHIFWHSECWRMHRLRRSDRAVGNWRLLVVWHSHAVANAPLVGWRMHRH